MSYKELSDESRVWIYQSNREFTDQELETILSQGNAFVQQWAAHGVALKAAFEVFYKRFIVIFADESQAGASGCSIDASVHFIRSIEAAYNVNLMDRMQLAYREKGEVVTLRMSDFEAKISEGEIDAETTVFNNLVTTKGEFDTGWEGPVKQSWHHRMMPLTTS